MQFLMQSYFSLQKNICILHGHTAAMHFSVFVFSASSSCDQPLTRSPICKHSISFLAVAHRKSEPSICYFSVAYVQNTIYIPVYKQGNITFMKILPKAATHANVTKKVR